MLCACPLLRRGVSVSSRGFAALRYVEAVHGELSPGAQEIEEDEVWRDARVLLPGLLGSQERIQGSQAQGRSETVVTWLRLCLEEKKTGGVGGVGGVGSGAVDRLLQGGRWSEVRTGTGLERGYWSPWLAKSEGREPSLREASELPTGLALLSMVGHQRMDNGWVTGTLVSFVQSWDFHFMRRWTGVAQVRFVFSECSICCTVLQIVTK